MPHPHENTTLKIPRTKDKRIKLTDKQREAIKASAASIHALAKEYNVSRRTVQFIKYPDRLAANKLARDKRGGSKAHYTKEAHAEYMSTHRAHKKSLYDNGELIEDND